MNPLEFSQMMTNTRKTAQGKQVARVELRAQLKSHKAETTAAAATEADDEDEGEEGEEVRMDFRTIFKSEFALLVANEAFILSVHPPIHSSFIRISAALRWFVRPFVRWFASGLLYDSLCVERSLSHGARLPTTVLRLLAD